MNGRRIERLGCVLAWTFAAAAAAVVGLSVARGCANVPYWDDFDAYLGFLLRIDHAAGFFERLRIATEFHNEHRTLVSRAAVWAAHAWGCPMDFRTLAVAGAAMFAPTVAVIALTTSRGAPRAAALFFAAAFLFNLQHWENLFWGGSSADHVSVVAFAGLALCFVQRNDARSFAAAVVAALLAAFTLAQGLVVIPVALVWLLLAKRWRAAAVWAVFAVVVGAIWMFGFPSEAAGVPEHGAVGDALLVGRFWLGLLGAPVAFGSRAAAPWFGAGLLAAVVVGIWMRLPQGRPFRAGLATFGLVALLAIAAGRATMDPAGYMVSRYRILSCLVWAVVAWLFFESANDRKPGRILRWALVTLVGAHWLEQTLDHWWRARAFHEKQMAGAVYFARNGTLAGAPTELYYDVPKADRILVECAARGIFDLARVGGSVTGETPRSPE